MLLRRLPLAVGLAALLAVLVPATVTAQVATAPAVDAAASALATTSVYVAPGNAAGLSSADAAEIDAAVRSAGGSMVIAVFAPGAGDPEPLGRQLADKLRRPAAFGIVAGPTGRTFTGGQTADGSGLKSGVSAKLAQLALQAKSPDAKAILLDYVARVKSARANDGKVSGGTPIWAIFVVPALFVIGGGFFFWSARRKRAAKAAQADELRSIADEDLVALGDDIRALDLDIEMPDIDPRAKEQYAKALQAFEQGNDALKRATAPEDFRPIGQTLEEGRYAMEAAKARLEGREPPEHRPPCFFDPRHGPSTRDVEWTPEFGAARLVPACEADAQRIERGEDPHAREIDLAGRGRVPYWQAPSYYGPYAGGYFGGFGGSGLLTGFLAGSLLAGGWGASDAVAAGGDGGSGTDWGGGGGGDWGGGGDFGGGDSSFGGGDDF